MIAKFPYRRSYYEQISYEFVCSVGAKIKLIFMANWICNHFGFRANPVKLLRV
jgi:hypothetical protein